MSEYVTLCECVTLKVCTRYRFHAVHDDSMVPYARLRLVARKVDIPRTAFLQPDMRNTCRLKFGADTAPRYQYASQPGSRSTWAASARCGARGLRLIPTSGHGHTFHLRDEFRAWL